MRRVSAQMPDSFPCEAALISTEGGRRERPAYKKATEGVATEQGETGELCCPKFISAYTLKSGPAPANSVPANMTPRS